MVRRQVDSPPPHSSDSESESDSQSESGGHTAYPGQNILIVGVDFGTTFSGVAYALSAQPDEIYVIQQWPGKVNQSYKKVPSEISYAPTNKNPPEGFAWGFEAQSDPSRIKWFKLLLDPTVTDQIADLKIALEEHTKAKPSNKEPVQVTKDYLSRLLDSLKIEIKRRYGPGLFSAIPKSFIFTVPAMWSDNAKALTEKAAKDAGFLKDDDEIRLVSEPEAAALYCLRTIQPCHIKEGNNIIVADCGGGTVDLTSYRVNSISPLRVAEAAIGEGKLCGSIYVNYSFEKFMKKKIGHSTFSNLKPRTKDALMKEFEEDVKCEFSDNPNQEIFTMRVPGISDTKDKTIEDGFLQLKRQEILEIFQPVLEKIERLVERQKKSIELSGGRVSALLLVGGFGESAYLFKRFKEWAANHGNIMVIQPQNAGSAVVRGAVIRGLESEKDLIQGRVSRRFYGVSYSAPFVPGIHPEKYKFWDAKLNKYYCRDRVNWFVEKGTAYSENTPLESSFCKTMWMHEFNDEDEKVVTSTLLAYDGDTPPKDSNNLDIVTVGKITSNLNKAPHGAWNKRNHGTKEDIMQVDYNLRMTLRGALLEFELRCMGEKFGTCNIVFDGQSRRR